MGQSIHGTNPCFNEIRQKMIGFFVGWAWTKNVYFFWFGGDKGFPFMIPT